MDLHTRASQLLKAVSRREENNPVVRERLLTLHNEPALEQPRVETLITASARTVELRGSDRTQLTLVQSKEHPDFFELPVGAHPVFGLPGRSLERLEIGGAAHREAARQTGPEERAEGFIPKTEAVIYHPLPVFAVKGTYFRSRLSRLDKCRPSRPSAASANHVNIFGGDERINIYPSGYPERCVCRIEVYIRAYDGGPWVFQKRGTGFIAGARIMMTSGHMRPDGPFTGWMIKVVPASYDGQSVYGSGFVTYVSDTHSWHSDSGNDLMVCRLYDPVGNTTGWFGATTYQGRWEDWAVWSMCGYPYDRGEIRPTFQGGIPVRDDDDGDDIRLPNGSEYDTTQVESEADEASGASGSPLYSWFDNGQMYAIGVHHGTETDYIFPFSSETLSAAAGGPGLPAIINWARSVWA